MLCQHSVIVQSMSHCLQDTIQAFLKFQAQQQGIPQFWITEQQRAGEARTQELRSTKRTTSNHPRPGTVAGLPPRGIGYHHIILSYHHIIISYHHIIISYHYNILQYPAGAAPLEIIVYYNIILIR